MNKRLLNKIKQTRITLGMSGRHLAQLSRLSPGVIYSVEDGVIPSAQSCAKLLVALHARLDAKRFSEKLKEIRAKLDVSLPKLAMRIGVSYGTLYKIETGYRPPMKLCCIIAKELDMPLEDFIEWPNDDVSNKVKQNCHSV
ncbi:hypothetical protein GAMM_130030 [Gammaproteobacteria bacterium]